MGFSEDFFTLKPDRVTGIIRRKCNLCITTFAVNSGGGTLRRHYRSNHVTVVLPNSRKRQRQSASADADAESDDAEVDLTESVHSSGAAAAVAAAVTVESDLQSGSVRSQSTQRSVQQSQQRIRCQQQSNNR